MLKHVRHFFVLRLMLALIFATALILPSTLLRCARTLPAHFSTTRCRGTLRLDDPLARAQAARLAPQ